MTSNQWGPQAGEPDWDFSGQQRYPDGPAPDFTQQPGAYAYTEPPYHPEFDQPEVKQPDPVTAWLVRAIKILLLGGVALFIALCIIAMAVGFLGAALGTAA